MWPYMGENERDIFSSRLHEQPARAQLEYYRIPHFEERMRYIWEPLLALNRSQAIVLRELDIIDASEAADIVAVLGELGARVDVDEFDDYESFEGPYFFIEDAVIEALGEEVGGKLHTGRSRNDLFAAAYRIAVRDGLLAVVDALLDLRASLLDRAAETTDVVFPAFTHSQPAQPITFAHYLISFDHLLGRDFDRLTNAFERTNQSPLGAAAIGGTGFPLDRDRLADLSGFSGYVHNTYDAISSVDYVPESTNALASVATNLSRVSQDFLLWSTFEIGFLELSEEMSGVSSIMPQKKNPYVLEKTRSVANDVIGAANSSIASLDAVPYGDVSENMYAALPFFGNVDRTVRAIRLFAAIVEDVELHEEQMYRDAVESFCTMTELSDTLVRTRRLSFRQAHEVVGRLTHNVYNDGRHAGEITVADLDRASEEMIGETDLLGREELDSALDPRQNVMRRDIAGGTAPEQNEADLTAQRDHLETQRAWLEKTRSRLADAREQRRNPDLSA